MPRQVVACNWSIDCATVAHLAGPGSAAWRPMFATGLSTPLYHKLASLTSCRVRSDVPRCVHEGRAYLPRITCAAGAHILSSWSWRPHLDSYYRYPTWIPSRDWPALGTIGGVLVASRRGLLEETLRLGLLSNFPVTPSPG
jgi:hypothetical protein